MNSLHSPNLLTFLIIASVAIGTAFPVLAAEKLNQAKGKVEIQEPAKKAVSDLTASAAAAKKGSATGEKSAAGSGNEKKESATVEKSAAGSGSEKKGAASAEKSAAGSGSEKKGSATVEKSAAGSGSEKKGSASAEKSAAGSGSEKKGSAKHYRSGFVPPPPPIVPTLSGDGLMGMGSTMVFVGENVDYMPLAEVLDLKLKTEKDLAKVRRTVDELTILSTERTQRAANFDGLYAQGVVSRRELEASKRENDSTSHELDEQKQTLAALELKFTKIEKRISDLNKKKSSSKSKK